MGVLYTKEYICIYADRPINRKDIVPCFPGEKRKNPEDFPKVCKISSRQPVIARIGSEAITYRISEGWQESDMQVKGSTHFYCIASFLSKKEVFHRGDIIAVFSAKYSRIIRDDPDPGDLMDWLLFLLVYVPLKIIEWIINLATGDKDKQHRLASEIFPPLIKKELEQNDNRDKRREWLENSKQRHQREREERERAELAIRLKEAEARKRIELEAERERLAMETKEIEKRLAMQRLAAEEEKRLTAELLEMRERMAKLDEQVTASMLGQALQILKR